MAHRYFEGKAHAMLYAKYRPIPPNQLIDRVISFIREKYDGPMELAFDLGCGSGQSTQFFAPYFSKVIGTDVSQAQINEANKLNKFKNVSFIVGAAEKIPAPNESVQLITASQSAHWFDLAQLYKEGQRSLCPNGVMAFYGYEFPRFIWKKNPTKNTLLDQALNDLYSRKLEKYIYPQSREVYLGKYKSPKYTIPFSSTFIRDESFYHEMDTQVSDIINYCLTWSGFQNFCKEKGDEAGAQLISDFQKRIMTILGVSTSPEDTSITKRTSFFLLLGRK